MRTLLLGVIALGLVSMVSLAKAQTPEIIIYGQNTPEWNKNLGVSATRSSCGGTPEWCMQNVARLLAGQHTERVYLNLPTDADKAIGYAKYYSKASQSEPRLYELAIDDFVDHFNSWCHTPRFRCDKVMNQIIDNTKSSNPKLKFGLTIYETEIASLLANPKFTPEIRRRIDIVHLYIIDRANGPNFESYLKQVNEGFPNAKVIAGAYPYDRIDYERCHNCSPVEARDLQKRTLRVEVQLIRAGSLAGIEFYPGFFGLEDRWPGWDSPRNCAPERRQQCIDETKTMHGDALMILRQLKSGSVQISVADIQSGPYFYQSCPLDYSHIIYLEIGVFGPNMPLATPMSLQVASVGSQ